jgi:alternate signal-mediated exported protein
MNKSTKGAIAAAAAGVLLLGGAGTLAYWTDSGTVAGGDIDAGTLTLSSPSCGSWTYDNGEDANGATFTPGTSLLVPGDAVSKTCTTTLTATGEHMRGTIVASAPNDISPFQVAVGSITDATTPLSGSTFTEANSGHNLSVTVTVTFPDNGDPGGPASGDNAFKLASATLDAITLTATQIHS